MPITLTAANAATIGVHMSCAFGGSVRSIDGAAPLMDR